MSVSAEAYRLLGQKYIEELPKATLVRILNAASDNFELYKWTERNLLDWIEAHPEETLAGIEKMEKWQEARAQDEFWQRLDRERSQISQRSKLILALNTVVSGLSDKELGELLNLAVMFSRASESNPENGS